MATIKLPPQTEEEIAKIREQARNDFYAREKLEDFKQKLKADKIKENED